MRTIGELAKSVGLSRSTLLYYDKLGLLSPSGHIKGEYRLYSDADQERLDRICQYRRAGLSLKRIARLMDDAEVNEMEEILEERLLELNREMQQMREQQAFIAALLGREELIDEVGSLSKESWINLLRAAGFSEAEMNGWHQRFEQSDPDKHEAFLKRLQISPDEITRIRKHAQRRSC